MVLPRQPTDDVQHECCAGMLYLSRSLQAAGKRPRCIGFKQIKQGDRDLEAARELSPNGEFKYYCLGYSSYAMNALGSTSLPYCEGLEVAVLEETSAQAPVDGSSSAGAPGTSARTEVSVGGHQSQRPAGSSPWNPAGDGTASPTSSSADTSDTPLSLRDKFMKTLSKNLDSMSATLKGEGPIKFSGMGTAGEMADRLSANAQRNLQRMATAATLVGSTVYSNTLKPLVDRILGEEDQ